MHLKSPRLARFRGILFAKEGTFDAVLSTGRSFAHLTQDDEIRACLRRVTALLRPGGVFACDSIDSNLVPPGQVRRVTESTPVGACVFRRDFVHTRLPGAGTTLDTTIHWRISEGDAIMAEFDDGTRHRAFSPGEMVDYFAAAGLEHNNVCSHFPHQPVILLASACKVVV